MGNTEMTNYMAANAFTNLGSVKSQFDNSSKWLAGLKASSTYDGKLFGVPYYAGSRVITYRTDLFKKAGVKKPPTSLTQFQGELTKIGKMEKHVQGVRAALRRRRGLVHRPELRLRLRRIDRREVARQVGRHARFEEVGRRA